MQNSSPSLLASASAFVAPKFALFGATGAIGHSIATAFRASGLRYRVVGRSASSLQARFGSDPLAETRTWDPDSPESIVRAAEGIDTLIYMVGVPYDQFALHPKILRQTIDGAVRAGVKRILLIGTLYPFGRPRTPRVNEDHPREPHTFKGRMRKAQEDALMEAHRDGRIEATILRLPDFYGPHVEASFFGGLFQAIQQGKRAQMVGPIDVPHEYVFVPDVGPIVVRLVQTPAAYGRTWNLGGAGPIVPRDFAERAFAQAGQKPRFLVAGKLMLRLLGLTNPFMRELVEMHYLITNPIIVDDQALETLIGPLKKTSYDAGIAACLRALKEDVESFKSAAVTT
ncbi:MAG: NAD-dependent epimerase/dehydratase family protein [Lacunisphaera sp.]